MVKTSLVDHDITEGKRFLDALRERTRFVLGKRVLRDFDGSSRFRVKAAFWWYLPESQEWRLIIATPLVEEEGPQAAYRDIRAVLATHPDLNIPLQSISVVSPKDEIVKAFQKAMRIAPNPEGTRFTRSALNGTYIEDAYVYRLS